MNNPLLSPSLAQQEYLADQLRRRSMIRIWRILLLILILSLWELSASLGLIDRFIFSSPSLILKCLISMTADRTIFLHTGVTLMETLISFQRFRAILSSFKQSAQIRPGPAFNRMAGK